MSTAINFRNVFSLLRDWFDTLTTQYDDFDTWRFSLYADERSGQRDRLPLKIWWPHYTQGDFRFEQVIGGLLVQQTSWKQVRSGIEAIDSYLKNIGQEFTAKGIAGIEQGALEDLTRSTGFFRQKARRINDFCTFIRDNYGNIGTFFEHYHGREDELGKRLMDLRMGFGRETRDCILLYGINVPVFIADAYARRLLGMLGMDGSGKIGYDCCQRFFMEGISGDFGRAGLEGVVNEYTTEELRYALPGYWEEDLGSGGERMGKAGKERMGLVLLYQQFHAGIVELGRSKRWNEFRDTLSSPDR